MLPKSPRIVAGLVLIAAVADARDSTDVVFMNNGDRITCEIKRLEDGLLYLKAKYTTAEFAVDWNLVDRIQSTQLFVMRMSDGVMLSGEMGEKSVEGQHAEGTLPILTEEGPQEAKRSDIVNIRQFGEGFLKKFDGAIDYGFSLTKANAQTQSNLHFDVRYGKLRDIVTAAGDSLFSRTEGVADTNRNEFALSYDRYFRRRWFGRGLSQFLQSDEQSLDLRSTYGGALGRRMVDSNTSALQLFAGAVATNEAYFDGPTSSQAEIIAGLELQTFKFDVSGLTFNTYVFPSISQWGRTRVNVNLAWNHKIIGNLRYRVSAFNNFDSQPPEGAARNDFGVTTGFGWTF